MQREGNPAGDAEGSGNKTSALEKSPLDDVDHVSRELVGALDGDRESALAMWQGIAKGDLWAEERVWIQHVAKAILEADREVSRPDALMKAVGLAGKADRWRRTREAAAAVRDFGCCRRPKIEPLLRAVPIEN